MSQGSVQAPQDTSPTEIVGDLATGETPPPQQPPLTDSAAPTPAESRGAHFIRMAHRTRLHLGALATVAVLVYVVALATSNTRRVKIDWVFAHSTVPLVWLTLFTAILGWLLGILITMMFRRRTRAPHAS